MVTLHTTKFNIQKFHVFLHCVCVFYMDHRTNSYFCIIQHWLIGFVEPRWRVFLVRYIMSPYIKQICFVSKRLNWVTLPSDICESLWQKSVERVSTYLYNLFENFLWKLPSPFNLYLGQTVLTATFSGDLCAFLPIYEV